MAETRVFVVRLNIIEPLNEQDPDAALFRSLNEKGIEVLGEIPAEKLKELLPLMVKHYETK